MLNKRTMYFPTCWFGLLLLIQLTDAKCPTFFETFNMACYYYGNNAVTSVAQAHASCRSLGGYLLNLNAELEFDHTVERIQAQYNLYDGYWVGGVLKGGYWVWQKTTPSGATRDEFMDPGATHYHWGPGEPGSYIPGVERFAALMVRGRQKPYRLYSEVGVLSTPRGMSYICEADWLE